MLSLCCVAMISFLAALLGTVQVARGEAPLSGLASAVLMLLCFALILATLTRALRDLSAPRPAQRA